MNPFAKKNQDLLDKTEKIRNAYFTSEMLEEISKLPVRTFAARFIEAGLCNYKADNDITLVPETALVRMADSFINRPVVKGHDINITQDNIMKKAGGRVVAIWKEETSDAWWVRFEIWDKDLLKAIDEENYFYVSCAYFITENGGAGKYNGFDYTTEVLDGFYHHLAITDNPRYTNSDIVRLNEEKDLNFSMFGDIVRFNEEEVSAQEIKENKGEKMFGIKKTNAEVDNDVVFATDCGELTTSQLVDKVNELNKQLNETKSPEVTPKKPEVDNKEPEGTKPSAPNVNSNEPNFDLRKVANEVATILSEKEKQAIASSEGKTEENVATVNIKG